MGRPLREEVEDGIHHVYARGNGRQRIYVDDVDRRVYLSLLGRVVGRRGWRCLAYCLMDNHVHLLIETPNANLGAGMQQLHGVYARTFNARHGGCGHLFQGRYGAVRIQDDAQLWIVTRYLARNPVEAGLCEAPSDWAWSSHGAALGRPGAVWLDSPRLLSYFGSQGGDSRDRYRDFVESAPPGCQTR
jgi:REP element-mobilizing transposase RayT